MGKQHKKAMMTILYNAEAGSIATQDPGTKLRPVVPPPRLAPQAGGAYFFPAAFRLPLRSYCNTKQALCNYLLPL